MIITKQQSKRLRYICGTVDYNQPCVKKYTGGPEGKIRQIGKFKYIERGNELVYFEYDGDVTPLSNYEAEEFLSALMDDSGFHLGGCIHVEDLPSAGTNNHNDIVDAVAGAVEHINVPVDTIHNGRDYSDVIAKELEKEEPFSNEGSLVHGLQIIEDVEKAKKIAEETNTPVITAMQKNKEPERAVTIDVDCAIPQAVDAVKVEVMVPPKNEVHEVNVPVEAQPATDDWMDGDGNDPDNIDQGTADIPELLTEEEKKAAEEDSIPPVFDPSTEVPPVKMTEHAPTKENAEKLKTPKQMSPEELTEDVIREISMTAAAREAARLHQIEYVNMPDVPSQNIIRVNAKIPGFLDDYGKCLKKVGMARTLTEIAKALPGQIDWIFR